MEEKGSSRREKGVPGHIRGTKERQAGRNQGNEVTEATRGAKKGEKKSENRCTTWLGPEGLAI